MSEKLKSTISVLLIDDQAIVGEAIKRMLQEEKDITFHHCTNPEKALEMASKVKPTVILQDLMMPQFDGLNLLRYFRANPATTDIPMIILSIKEDPVVKAKAFALGANDYLVKIPDKVELIARIRYHSAAYTRLLERNFAYEQLSESESRLQTELAEAAQYVRSLLPDPMRSPIKIDWRYIPSKLLGGDAFDYEWLDEDNLLIYLLDVCGHGVGAALLSITVMNTISSHVLLGVDYWNPSDVMSALNAMFPMEKYNNLFFTMWYGVYNRKEQSITYATAGHPPAILLSGDTLDTLQVQALKTPGIVIGGIADAHFENNTCFLKKINKLYIFSDGIYELAKPDGSMFKLDEFVSLLEKQPKEGEDTLSRILNFVKSVNVDGEFSDDVSILEVII